MARKSKRPTKRASTPTRNRRKASRRRAPVRSKVADPLDAFVVAAARALGLPAEAGWLPAIRANLRVTLQHAAAVAEHHLPDDAEPAPVFKA